jgi:2,4-dienoyl-CoA reductase-like NADH-dependent reductase (Old Yellow Enzyme family)
MSDKTLGDSLVLNNGKMVKNRLWLAPLTNLQSNDDGVLSDDEYHWLVKRAEGGFSVVHTCAALAEASGQGFPGQLGVHDDRHLAGMSRLAEGISSHGAIGIVQLHHAGFRTPIEVALDGVPVSPSAEEKYHSRALETNEVERIIEQFIRSAERCQRAGFDGVEVHGAHSYLIAQFLSTKYNRRTDRFGGSLENRSRVLMDITSGIRERCGSDFIVGVRLSPEGFGVELDEMKRVFAQLVESGWVNYIDLSLWDVRKTLGESDDLLIDQFMSLPRGDVMVGVAGHIYGGQDAQWCLDKGADFTLPGRAAILHYDFAERVINNVGFTQVALPVSRDYLRQQALGEKFIDYMSKWDGFVENDA